MDEDLHDDWRGTKDDDTFLKVAREDSHILSIKAGLITSGSLALSNFLMSELSARLSYRAVCTSIIGNFSCWLLYHMLNPIFKFENEGDSLAIYKKDDDKICGRALMAPMARAVIALLGTALLNTSFYFALVGPAQINTGILSSMFSTSIVFSAIIFYCWFGQRLKKGHLCGMALILISVIVISIASEMHEQSTIKALGLSAMSTSNVRIALFCAIGVGFLFAINLVAIQVVLNSWPHFPPVQLGQDMNFWVAMFLFPWFAYEMGWGEGFSTRDLIVSTIATYASTVGQVASTYGLKYGKGGLISALENLKSIWTTALVCLFQTHHLPPLASIGGLVLGLLGVQLIISFK